MKTQKKKIFQSKIVITETFIRMLAERPGESITIKDLCKEAGYSRATFYTHFQNTQDVVFYHYETSWLEPISEDFDKLKSLNLPLEQSFKIATNSVFTYWKTQIETYKLLQSVEMEDVLLKLFEAVNGIFIPKFFEDAESILNSVSGECIVKGGSRLLKTVYDVWIQSGVDMDTEKAGFIIYKFYSSTLNETQNLL